MWVSDVSKPTLVDQTKTENNWFNTTIQDNNKKFNINLKNKQKNHE